MQRCKQWLSSSLILLGITYVASGCRQADATKAATSTADVALVVLPPDQPDRFTCDDCHIRFGAVVDFGEGIYGPYRAGNTIKTDHLGRFWTARTYEEGTVAVYDSAGRFLTKLGSAGDGPGEMRFISAMTQGPDGMYLADAQTNRLNVFDDSLRLIRTHPLHFGVRSLAALSDGRLVAWFYSPYGPEPATVHLLSDSGRYMRPLLSAPTFETDQQQMLFGDNVITTTPNGDILVGGASNYSIRVIRNGAVVQELTSPVNWFDSYAEYERDNSVRLSRMKSIAVDEHNRAWVLFNVPNPAFVENESMAPGSDGFDPVIRTLTSSNSVIEVWDLSSGKLLAGIKLSPRLIAFSDSRHVYTYIETDSGEIRARVWSFALDVPTSTRSEM